MEKDEVIAAVVADEDDEEDDEVEGGEETAVKKKKNKKKKKKKKADAAAYNTISSLPDDKFNEYCASVLESSKVPDLPPADKLLAVPDKFNYYPFTGTTRPAFVSKRVSCPPHITGPEYAVSGRSPTEEAEDRRSASIYVNTPEDIAKMKHASKIGREILDVAGRYLRAGVTGDEIDRIVHHVTVKEFNAYPSTLNYYDFPKSVCVSVNEIICHGIPDFRVVQDGDIVNIDVSVYVDGVHADLNETFLVGECDEESKRLVKAAYQALQAACAMIKPGTFYRDVGLEITKVATKAGCAVVKTYSGHGVGKMFHCAPTVPHYAHNKAVGIMRPGHIFTIEPMLNLGSNWGDIMWPDRWTVSTKDGKRSSQFEHVFLVTETGVDILTAIPGTSKTEMASWEAMEAKLFRPGSKPVAPESASLPASVVQAATSQ